MLETNADNLLRCGMMAMTEFFRVSYAPLDRWCKNRAHLIIKGCHSIEDLLFNVNAFSCCIQDILRKESLLLSLVASFSYMLKSFTNPLFTSLSTLMPFEWNCLFNLSCNDSICPFCFTITACMFLGLFSFCGVSSW